MCDRQDHPTTLRWAGCGRWLAGLAIVGCLALPGCAAFRPIRGIPASHAPAELLGESREGARTINLSLLTRRPQDQYRVEAGDILAVYIPGLLGPRTVIGPNLTAQVVGESPPITAPANSYDPPLMGYPITIRDDHTLVLPQLPPLPVRGLTLREVEMRIADACRQAQLLQEQNIEILVSLWRPREYRVLVVRQEATEDLSGGAAQQGTVNVGKSKRGSGHVVRLRAYENDVLHALSDNTVAANGLPGLDAENAIYIIRRSRHGSACPPAELSPVAPTPVGRFPQPAEAPYPTAAPYSAVPPNPVPIPERTPGLHSVTPPLQTPAPQPGPAAGSPEAPGYLSPPAGGVPYAPAFGTHSIAPTPQSQPLSPERIQYGTPENGMPILPQSHQVIRGQSPGGPGLMRGHSAYSASRSGRPGSIATESAPGRDGGILQTSYAEWSEPLAGPASASPVSWPAPGMVPASSNPYAGPPVNGYPPAGGYPPAMQPTGPGWAPAPGQVPSAPWSAPAVCPPGAWGIGEYGEADFTIDGPNVIRIPIRLAPGQSPNITEEDITLYDGDIIFIESRDTEVFYTGGLLGGGEYMLPRDRDLHVTEAISVAQSNIQAGGPTQSVGGVSALNGDVSVSPSRVIVRRRFADGRIVPIEVDLYRARLRAEEDILIMPRDLILLEYTCGEATLAFIERHLLAGALFGVAAAQMTTN
ncbi:MAG: hypothetical protein KF774_11855 [Planctomyces sp.]|nr:hypothetical protein [Planctomyces sp.]